MSIDTEPTTSTGHRAYFVDGPARGRSTFEARTPWCLTWYHHESGSAHAYQRIGHIRGTRYYRHAG